MFPYFAQCFLFWRGSRRIRVLMELSDYAQCLGDTISRASSQSTGIAFTNNTQNGIGFQTAQSLEIPWVSEVPYVFIDRNPNTSVSTSFDDPYGCYYTHVWSDLPALLNWSPGDDFQFLYVFMPGVQPA